MGILSYISQINGSGRGILGRVEFKCKPTHILKATATKKTSKNFTQPLGRERHGSVSGSEVSSC